MSLITTCPACSTSFYVTQQQLTAHKGDLRCGKCNHVFNATNRVTEVSKSVEPEAEAIIEFDETPVPEVKSIEVPAELAPSKIDLPTDVLAKSAPVNAIAEPQAIPSFLSDSALKSKFGDKQKPQTKSHVVLFSVLSVLLVIVIAIQSAYFMRVPLSSKYPPLKPYLVKLCGLLHCQIPLPRQIELWTIDDSDLQEDADHVGLIHLSTTMINNAAFAQDYPLLELTLTDINDKPLLRRAFQPSEYLPTDTNIANGLGPGEEVHIKLNLTASGEPVAGYRVFVAY